jgi:hypothetical protein
MTSFQCPSTQLSTSNKAFANLRGSSSINGSMCVVMMDTGLGPGHPHPERMFIKCDNP